MAFGIIDLLSLQQGFFAGVDESPYTPISYPLSHPTNVGPRRVSFKGIEATIITQSPFSYASQIQSHDADMWVWEVTLPPMEREDAEEWNAFILSLRGVRGTFLMGDPLGKTPRGVATGTPTVKDDNQSGRTLTSKGWTPSTTNILRAGDYIQIGQRLHKLLRNVNSNGAGEATLDIWPRIREIPVADDEIITTNCKGLFRLASSSFDIWSADETRTYATAFPAVEAFT